MSGKNASAPYCNNAQTAWTGPRLTASINTHFRFSGDSVFASAPEASSMTSMSTVRRSSANAASSVLVALRHAIRGVRRAPELPQRLDRAEAARVLLLLGSAPNSNSNSTMAASPRLTANSSAMV